LIEEQINLEEKLNPTPKIYSRKAILIFSAICSPLFGGFLLRQNLLDIKNKKAANKILIISTIFTGISIFILYHLSKRSPYNLFLNGAFGFVLSEYYFRKYFPAENYQYKTNSKPLIIAIITLLACVFAIVFIPRQ
jgi:hypothetical protein